MVENCEILLWLRLIFFCYFNSEFPLQGNPIPVEIKLHDVITNNQKFKTFIFSHDKHDEKPL